jgi:hypothetical protein
MVVFRSRIILNIAIFFRVFPFLSFFFLNRKDAVLWQFLFLLRGAKWQCTKKLTKKRNSSYFGHAHMACILAILTRPKWSLPHPPVNHLGLFSVCFGHIPQCIFFSSSKKLHTTNRCTHISSIQILRTGITSTFTNAHAPCTHKFFTQVQRALNAPQGICNTTHHEIRWRDEGL